MTGTLRRAVVPEIVLGLRGGLACARTGIDGVPKGESVGAGGCELERTAARRLGNRRGGVAHDPQYAGGGRPC